MNRFNPYSTYSLTDLLNDDTFIFLVNKRRSDPALLDEWEQITAAGSDSGSAFREAAQIIELAAGRPLPAGDNGHEKIWKNIATEIDKTARVTPFRWWRVAALVLLLVSIGGITYHYFKHISPTVKWNTAEEQFMVVTLPDQSTVTLGANSTLTYKKNWKNGSMREVWLSGDAHFEVTHLNRDSSHINEGEKFVVHVENEMEVEVLGTVFNVRHGSGKTTVELESGSVEIVLKNRHEANVRLKPGEKAELDIAQQTLTRLLSTSRHPTPSPGDKSIELNNTSVKEIIQMIETTYHKNIEVADTSLLSRRIDGTFPICHEKDVWFILSSILDINIEIKSDDSLVLQPR